MLVIAVLAFGAFTNTVFVKRTWIIFKIILTEMSKTSRIKYVVSSEMSVLLPRPTVLFSMQYLFLGVSAAIYQIDLVDILIVL